MLIAVEYLGNVGVGVTSPQFFRANDGKVYVVKLQNNKLGAGVLVSEFLGAKFGRIMNLCFPPSDIIEVNEDMILHNPALAELGALAGRHFASQFIDNAAYITPPILHQITNVTEMAGIMLFDHIFHNSDRTGNRRNLLVCREAGGYKIYAIDNSHLFRSGRWTLNSLVNLGNHIKVYYYRSYGLLLRDYLSPQDFLPYLAKFEQLTDEEIAAIVQEIPAEWLPGTVERIALNDYIKLRRDLIREIWDRLCKQIPRERGGLRWLTGKVIGWSKKRSQQRHHLFKRHNQLPTK
jgi:hypothetical protein